MTIEELKKKRPLFVNSEEVAGILGVNPASIRSQAQGDPTKLGFPVMVIGTRVKIPVKPFLKFLGEE